MPTARLTRTFNPCPNSNVNSVMAARLIDFDRRRVHDRRGIGAKQPSHGFSTTSRHKAWNVTSANRVECGSRSGGAPEVARAARTPGLQTDGGALIGLRSIGRLAHLKRGWEMTGLSLASERTGLRDRARIIMGGNYNGSSRLH